MRHLIYTEPKPKTKAYNREEQRIFFATIQALAFPPGNANLV